MQNFIIKLTQKNLNLLESECAECYIISAEMPDNLIKQAVEKIHDLNKLILMSGNKAEDFYQKYQTDGFILDCSTTNSPAKIVKAAQKKAPKAIIGVISRNRRHEAMLISECEPDFIIFRLWREGLEKNLELLQWYSDLFLIQCAALPEEDIPLKNIPADFLILDSTGTDVTKI